jgi:hypothetical protein
MKPFRFPRLSAWLLATMLLLMAILALAPQQLPVSLYKLSLVTTAGLVGYWLDRSLFPYARPDLFIDESWSFYLIPEIDRLPGERTKPPKSSALVFAAAMIRRALIVGAAMLSMGLGA